MRPEHRSIVVVDIEAFSDLRRSGFNQVAVRDGLYGVLRSAFDGAGVPWDECEHEDRGDGVLVLVPPTVAKSLLIDPLPRGVAAALRTHNRAHGAEEQIRLRMAVHAGEIQHDDHGVVGRAVNLTFRLLDAQVVKDALAESSGALVLVTSSWFFDEVVWHSRTGDRGRYRRVSVSAKETETVAWICLPDHDAPNGAIVPTGLGKRLPVRGNAPVPRQLPMRTRQFVGRDEEIGRLSAVVGEVTIVAIDGTAGMGKTALALHWAHKVVERFPDGQLHVDLRGFGPREAVDVGQALHGFLLALGVDPQGVPADVEAKAALYRSLVAERRLLVVLDNARSADHVRPLLPGSRSCLVIITSRHRLDSLAVREGAHRFALDALSPRDAFAMLTRRVDPALLETGAAAELIELCVRLPLALSIVAARVAGQPTSPLSTLVGELRDERNRLDVLDLGDVDLDLRAVLSWSYDELSPDAKRLFRLLGVHPGPDVDLHASAALVGLPTSRTRTLLQEITNAHLLTEHVPHRFRFHDLLRVYASERSQDDALDEERAEATGRVLRHYLHAALLADRHIQPCRDGVVRSEAVVSAAPAPTTYRDAADWFTAEQATLLAVVDFAAEHDGSAAWRLAWACTTFLRRTGRRHERVAVHRAALTAARRAGDRLGEVVAHRHLASAIARLGGYDEALDRLAEVLRLSESFEDPNRHQIHLACARVLAAQQRDAEAFAHAEAAWELVRRTENRQGQADVLTTAGRQRGMLGQYVEALADSERALALYSDLGHREGQADVLVNIGYLEQHLGLHARAVASYERSLAIDRELGDRYWEAFALDHLGDAHHATGAHDQARNAWSEALDVLQSLRHPDTERVRAKLGGRWTTPAARDG